MAKAVCIITSTGIMKCLASPLKSHFPAGRDCTVDDNHTELDNRIAQLMTLLRESKLGLSDDLQLIIANVTKLLIAAHVDRDSDFTIVRAGPSVSAG